MDENSIEKVRALEREKSYQEAEIILLDLISSAPGNLYYKAKLADLRLKERRLQEAELLADEILSQAPADFYGLLIKGNIMMKRNKGAEAFGYFEAAYKSSSTAYAASQMVEAKLKAGPLEEALEIARGFVREYPDDKWLKKRLARIEELCNNKEEALKIYEELRVKEPEDDKLLASVMRLKAEISEQGDAQDLEKILKLNKYKENVPLIISTAQMHFRSGDFRKAAEYYGKAHNLEPENRYVIKQLGFCYNRLREDELAACYLKMAMKNNPRDLYVRSALISVYKRLNKTEEFIDFLKELLIELPDFTEAYGIIRRLSKSVKER